MYFDTNINGNKDDEILVGAQCEKSTISLPKPVPELSCNNLHGKSVKTVSLSRIRKFQIFSILSPKS